MGSVLVDNDRYARRPENAVEKDRCDTIQGSSEGCNRGWSSRGRLDRRRSASRGRSTSRCRGRITFREGRQSERPGSRDGREHPSGNQDAGSRRQVTGGDVASLGHPERCPCREQVTSSPVAALGHPERCPCRKQVTGGDVASLGHPERCPCREQVTSSPLAALGSTKGVAKCRQRRNS